MYFSRSPARINGPHRTACDTMKRQPTQPSSAYHFISFSPQHADVVNNEADQSIGNRCNDGAHAMPLALPPSSNNLDISAEVPCIACTPYPCTACTPCIGLSLSIITRTRRSRAQQRERDELVHLTITRRTCRWYEWRASGNQRTRSLIREAS